MLIGSLVWTRMLLRSDLDTVVITGFEAELLIHPHLMIQPLLLHLVPFLEFGFGFSSV